MLAKTNEGKENKELKSRKMNSENMVHYENSLQIWNLMLFRN